MAYSVYEIRPTISVHIARIRILSSYFNQPRTVTGWKELRLKMSVLAKIIDRTVRNPC